MIDEYGVDVNEVENGETAVDVALRLPNSQVVDLLTQRGGLPFAVLEKARPKRPRLALEPSKPPPRWSVKDYEVYETLVAQLPEEFVGRENITFYRCQIVYSFKRSAEKELFIKVRYEAASPRDESTWVILVDTPRGRRRELWEVLGSKEPIMSFDPEPTGLQALYPFRFTAVLDETDLMSIFVETRNHLGCSQYLNAKKEVAKSVKEFGADRVRGIAGYWWGGSQLSDNFLAFVKALAGLPPEQAVFQTFTGRQAKAHGFLKVKFADQTMRHIQERLLRREKEVFVQFIKP